MRLPGISFLPVAVMVAAGCSPATADFPSGCGDRTVALVVEPALAPSIREGVSQLEADLCTDGYNTVEKAAAFATPLELRAYLQSLHDPPSRGLVGALLIGDLPHADQLVKAAGSFPLEEEVISFQYYADLNGTFAKSATYGSPGGHESSYDLHGGDLAWEIWVGILPRYNGDPTQTADAINRYLAKNHAFRTRQLVRPNVYLEISEHFHATTLEEHEFYLNDMRQGPYAWTPYSNAPGALLYFDSPPGGLSVEQGYAAMQSGLADLVVAGAHGYWGASGQLTIDRVETSPVPALFFWSDGCAVGDLDHTQNFLTSVLYSPTSDVLVAKGTTNNSGGLGTNANGFFGHNIATALSTQQSLGDAVLGHINVPLISPWAESREFHFGTLVILGDPSLRRSNDWWERAPYASSCAARPAQTVCVRYDDGYVWLVRDSILRWETAGEIQTAVGMVARYEHLLGTSSVRVSH